MKKSVMTIYEDYMQVALQSEKELLNYKIANSGAEAITSDVLSDMYADFSMDSLKSAYVYVVTGDGTMFYHPTKDKIGKPVENEVVKGIIKEIKEGNIPKDGVKQYVFNGVNKYCSYSIVDSTDFVIVLVADKDDVLKTIQLMNTKLILGSIFSLLVCGIVSIIIAISTVKPIKRLTKVVNRTANLDFLEDKELTALAKKGGESGEISRAVESLQGKVKEVIKDIKIQTTTLEEAALVLDENSKTTQEAISQVEKAVNDIAQGATSQAEETQRATQNVIAMGELIKDTTDKINILNVGAQSIQESSDNAVSILDGLRDTNSKASKFIDTIYEQTNVTNESAQKIKEALSIITAIAEETNLLSLNASIEAARAGEQGRGFAVVASQIQKLAEQSNNSVQSIDRIIESLLQDSTGAVETMNQVKEVMEEQSKKVKETDDVFTVVKQGVDQSIQAISEISEKTKGIDKARVNVVDVVQELTAIAEENAASTEETSAYTAQVNTVIAEITEKISLLNNIVSTLEEKIQQFTV